MYVQSEAAGNLGFGDADLAGVREAPLLQETIAATIGYGARPGSANQRWMVFDLGGGTLDIAVVSTREGRLNVLEHRGNNLVGRKGIDRSIVEQVLFWMRQPLLMSGRQKPREF